MHITFTKNMHECFLFIYFYLVKLSCQNTIFLFKKKIANESYEIRMEKNAEKWRKEKNTKVLEGTWLFSLYVSYSSSSSSLLHCTAKARARLGVVSGWKIPEKGAGKENRAKTVSFWPVFLKLKRPKRRCFGPTK